jgi:hypothetical protein
LKTFFDATVLPVFPGTSSSGATGTFVLDFIKPGFTTKVPLFEFSLKRKK